MPDTTALGGVGGGLDVVGGVVGDSKMAARRLQNGRSPVQVFWITSPLGNARESQHQLISNDDGLTL